MCLYSQFQGKTLSVQRCRSCGNISASVKINFSCGDWVLVDHFWLGRLIVLSLIAPRPKVGDVTAIEKLTESMHETIFRK